MLNEVTLLAFSDSESLGMDDFNLSQLAEEASSMVNAIVDGGLSMTGCLNGFFSGCLGETLQKALDNVKRPLVNAKLVSPIELIEWAGSLTKPSRRCGASASIGCAPWPRARPP
jgi:hypothetical protein